MKIITKEEEAANYNETLKGGVLGGTAGLVLGAVGIYGASIRYPAFRHLSVPLRAFLVTSSTTFGAIVTADHFSRALERKKHAEEGWGFKDQAAQARQAGEAAKSSTERLYDWAATNRYKLVGGSWVVSIIVALALTGRNPYLSTAQKLVQARVYAQALTVATMIGAAGLEVGDRNAGEGRWETVKVLDPNDPKHLHMIEKQVHKERYEGEDQWRDMIDAEEERLKARDAQAEHLREKKHPKAKKQGEGEPSKRKNGGSTEEHHEDRNGESKSESSDGSKRQEPKKGPEAKNSDKDINHQKSEEKGSGAKSSNKGSKEKESDES